MLNQYCRLRAIKKNERVRGRETIIPPVKPVKENKKLRRRRSVVGFHLSQTRSAAYTLLQMKCRYAVWLSNIIRGFGYKESPLTHTGFL
jgi:hypothetical protein